MAELTPKQEMFCKEYIIDLNATQACIRAGYSKNNADKIGSELLGKTRVREYVNILMDKRSKKIEITAEDVLQDIYDTRQTAKEQDKLSERTKCNELLGKHLKLFTDKTEITGKDGNPIETRTISSSAEWLSGLLGTGTKTASKTPSKD